MFLLGVSRKQLGLTFLGETKQDFACVIGDICLEIEGVDRKVRTTPCLHVEQFIETISSTGMSSATDPLTCECRFPIFFFCTVSNLLVAFYFAQQTNYFPMDSSS